MATPPIVLRHALLAGGGSGGHVFPALAVARELAERGWQVSYVGQAGGLEERLAGERRIPFHPLAASPFLGRGAWARARALGTLAGSSLRGARLVRRLGADVVVGTGGYVSAPAVIGARFARRPVLLVEPNAHPGLANRLASRFATEAALGYDAAAGALRCPSTVTGVPVRADFFAVAADLPAGPLRLLVLGGSQGARQINRLLAEAAPELLARFPGLEIVHQAGPKNLDEARELYARSGAPLERVQLVPFLDDVAGAMAAAHLLLSRAGAITISEICAAGRPSLLVPLTIAEGHQMENARALAEAGAAELATAAENEAGAALARHVSDLLADRGRLATMARAARALARPDAVAAIADRVEALAAQRGGRG